MDGSSTPKYLTDLLSMKEETRDAAFRRIRLLCLHLTNPSASSAADIAVETIPCSSGSVSSPHLVDAAALRAYMRVPHQEDHENVLEFFRAHPELRPPADGSQLPLEQHRELVMRQMKALVRDAGFRPFQYLLGDMYRYVNVLDAAGRVDLSLTIKLGVQCSLWGSSVVNLGTQKHREKYFEGIDNLDYPGCFAMTELHHGSNVQALQTTAVFDRETDEFVIHTPNDGAIKWWIGNAAAHGKLATVFARLILPRSDGGADSPSRDMGIHAFIVPIRDMHTHAICDGVEIQDCGHKVGLNGVDNGALRFNSVRIPRENLLNRFGDVSREGHYTSPLPTAGKRFAAMLGELVGGRVGLAYGSVSILKVSTTIAVRYSLLRRQFGPANGPEVCILDHKTQQRKLMPMLASAYAFHFAAVHMVGKYSESRKSGDELAVGDLHSLAAGLKAYITSYTAKSISVCRESCGGHGYAAVNVLGTLRNDHDVFQTFEGDNTVLMQQVAGELVKQYGQKFKAAGTGAFSLTWSYLRESMTAYLSTPTHMTARCVDEDHLRDPKFQLEAFRYRTSRLLHTVAMRLRKHTKELGSFGAWNHCLNHLLSLAEAHVETIILEHFIRCVDSCPDPSTRAALKLICDVYALERIWSDIGTFRNADYLAPNKAKAIFKLTERLCYEMRCVAQQLVDAFDLPDFAIRAPIGMQDADAYNEYTQCVGF